MKKFKSYLSGVIIGMVNGFFGAAGGVVAVELLKKDGVEEKKAHATSIAIILIISMVSTFMYFFNGKIEIEKSFLYIIGGFFGAITGSLLLKRIPNNLLRRIFGLIIIISGIRLLLK